ncbi:MAG: hypothetical protein J7K58_03085 [Euryarchaeota archaeon]|nr:hypothetical protein [Euryarchaeota archaeon]
MLIFAAVAQEIKKLAEEGRKGIDSIKNHGEIKMTAEQTASSKIVFSGLN